MIGTACRWLCATLCLGFAAYGVSEFFASDEPIVMLMAGLITVMGVLGCIEFLRKH